MMLPLSLPERSVHILLSVGAVSLVLFLLMITIFSRSKKLALTMFLLSAGLVVVGLCFTLILYEALYPLF